MNIIERIFKNTLKNTISKYRNTDKLTKYWYRITIIYCLIQIIWFNFNHQQVFNLNGLIIINLINLIASVYLIHHIPKFIELRKDKHLGLFEIDVNFLKFLGIALTIGDLLISLLAVLIASVIALILIIVIASLIDKVDIQNLNHFNKGLLKYIEASLNYNLQATPIPVVIAVLIDDFRCDLLSLN